MCYNVYYLYLYLYLCKNQGCSVPQKSEDQVYYCIKLLLSFQQNPPLIVRAAQRIPLLCFVGAVKTLQLLCEGENKPAAAGQARDEHFECHAGDSQLGKDTLDFQKCFFHGFQRI